MSQPITAPYSSIHQSRLQYLKQQIAALNLPPGAKILDVGCFPPLIFNHLTPSFDTWGICSPHESLSNPKIVSLNIDSDPIPLPSRSFDLIIFSEVIEHLYHNVPGVLSKLNKLLKPGGKLILTTPNAVSLFVLGKVIGGLNPAFPLSDLTKDNPKTGSIYHRHNREYTLSELDQLLVTAGFKIKQKNTFTAYTPTRPHMRQKPFGHRALSFIVYFLAYLFPSRKDSLFFLALK